MIVKELTQAVFWQRCLTRNLEIVPRLATDEKTIMDEKQLETAVVKKVWLLIHLNESKTGQILLQPRSLKQPRLHWRTSVLV